ncbi:MAG: hypothetical protein LBM39_01665 [Candidatus Methanoplasma sp.]|jgi:transglutaminase/protease-like cytokinesis protein 3|nr:hypothetical protein [Candidatus Methanoplasma sp.]
MKGRNGLFVITAVISVIALLSVPAFAENGSDGDAEFKSYYDQLDINGKAIYDAISAADADTRELTLVLPIPLVALDNAEGEEFLKEKVDELCNRTYLALRFGNPMAYWLWGSTTPHGLYVPVEKDNVLIVEKIDFDVNTLDTNYADGLQEKIDALKKAVDDFESDSTDARGKVSDINKYLTGLVTYDPDPNDKDKKSYFDHEAYGALADERHYAVCDGYAKAFQLLADKLGITSIQVYGGALPSMVDHAWNYVLMDDGKWYAIDVTWNDTKDDAYFLLGAETFLTDHQQGSSITAGTSWDFDYPPLSSGKYDSDPPSYESYGIALVVAMGAVIAIALFYAARKGNL